MTVTMPFRVTGVNSKLWKTSFPSTLVCSTKAIDVITKMSLVRLAMSVWHGAEHREFSCLSANVERALSQSGMITRERCNQLTEKIKECTCSFFLQGAVKTSGCNVALYNVMKVCDKKIDCAF